MWCEKNPIGFMGFNGGFMVVLWWLNGFHPLVMIFTVCHGKKITIFKFGKPSISMDNLYHGYVK